MSFDVTERHPVSLKGERELAIMQENARLLFGLFAELHRFIQAGSTGVRIQEFCRAFLARTSMQSLLRGYRDFPADLCISVNEVAVHGLPDMRPFQPDDVVSIDLAGRRGLFCADAAWTWVVPPASAKSLKLIAAAWQCCAQGIAAGGRSRRISAMGRAVQERSQALGHFVLPRFGGHGIGRHLHEAPLFAFIDAPQGDDQLTDGMVVNVEPVICQSGTEVTLAADGWSWTCPPGIRAAQFEFSLALQPDGGFTVLNLADQSLLQEPMPPFY